MKPWFRNIMRGAYGIEPEPSYYGYSRISELSDDVAKLSEMVDMNTSLTGAMDRVVERQQTRLERAIRGAIRAGYDGVDIHRPHNMAQSNPVSRVRPWSHPAPEPKGDYRTERFAWDWFSDDELTRILTDDGFAEELSEGFQ